MRLYTRGLGPSSPEPHFEFKPGKWKGKPVAEILMSGKPFWEELSGARVGFTFGSTKAALIVIWLDTIREFVDSNGELPGTESSPKQLEEKGRRLDWHPSFRKGASKVHKPYLELSYRRATIRFGLLKARAFLQFEKELCRLASGHHDV